MHNVEMCDSIPVGLLARAGEEAETLATKNQSPASLVAGRDAVNRGETAAYNGG